MSFLRLNYKTTGLINTLNLIDTYEAVKLKNRLVVQASEAWSSGVVISVFVVFHQVSFSHINEI